MEKKAVSGIMLTLILISTLILTCEAPSVNATSTAFSDVVTRILEPGDDLIHGFAYYEGYLWASTRTSPCRILKIDSETLDYERIILDIGLNDGEDLIAVAGYIWVILYTSPSKIIRVDPETLAWEVAVTFQSAELSLGGSLEYAFGYLWAGGSDRKIVRIDLSDLTYDIYSYPTVVSNSQFHALTSGGGYIWGSLPHYSYWSGWYADTIVRINPTNPADYASVYISRPMTDDMAYVGGYLHTGSETSPSYIYKISDSLTYSSAQAAATVCYGIFAYGNSIWGAYVGSPGKIVEFDLNLNVKATHQLPVGFNNANEIAFDPVGNTYVTCWESPAKIVKFSGLAEWSFAVIADLHIGWGYSDYGGSGYDDPDLGATQDYWLTNRLEKVVEKISEAKDAQDIKFVVVLGDIADTAEKSEFLQAREILSRLNDPNGDGDTTDGIPYIPVIGNHDIWPYTMTQGTDPDTRDEKYVAVAVGKADYNPDNLGDRYFQKIFWEDEESQNNRDLIALFFGSSWERQLLSSAPYLQNYKFRFGDMSFVCLDFNPRDPDMAYPGESGMSWGFLTQPHDDSWAWFYQFLMENEDRNVVAFSHHAMSLEGGFNAPPKYLQDHLAYVEQAQDIIEQYNVAVHSFGGHTHVNYVSSSSLAQDVVETEAIYQESADIIRIVKMNGQQVNYSNLDGVSDIDPGLGLFFTLNPGNPSHNQDMHFVARTVDFAGGRPNLRLSKEVSGDCLSCYYDWVFGDGVSLQGWGNPIPKIGADDPAHSYDSAGAYRLDLTVNTPEGTVDLNRYPVFISGEISPMRYICGLPENYQAVSTGRGVSVVEGEDGQNTFETVLMSKTASPETPIVEFGVHFENATEDIDLSTCVADVNITKRKAFFYMASWPEVIEGSKTLYVPSSGVGAVYVCFNITSLDEVSYENADLIINVGETKNNLTVATAYYNEQEYYLVYGNVTDLAGGEIPRDVAITGITLPKTIVGQGFNLPINVTVQNQGALTENFNLTVWANTTIIATATNISLPSGNFTTIMLSWDTGGIPFDNYIITANATTVPHETDMDNNTYMYGIVTVSIAGDVNGDRKVDASDLVNLNEAYGSTYGSPTWNSNCDVNGDNRVDVLDLFIQSKNYGKTNS